MVFPARAGMSPADQSRFIGAPCVPRASGDEPAWLSQIQSESKCSPRERG